MRNSFGKYNHYGMGWRGSFMVWVLRGERGTEYVVGEDAVPPGDRMGEVIARIGPIAYEEGQGLERFAEKIAQDVATAKAERQAKYEREMLMSQVRREIEARIPAPVQDRDTEGAAEGR